MVVCSDEPKLKDKFDQACFGWWQANTQSGALGRRGMYRNVLTRILAVGALGTLLQFAGCLGVGGRRALQDPAPYADLEFFLDTSGVLDFFAL